MNERSVSACRRDEWSALILCVMKTSLSVAHELGLSPDAVLNCASRYLRFRDFASFASAMVGASRASDCCARRECAAAVEVAYVKTLAARIDSDRNVLCRVPTTCSSDLQSHVEAPDLAYEKVETAVQALKDDVRRTFSKGGVVGETAVQDALGFARALTAIMSTDDNALAYERAMTAILQVRFAAKCSPVDDSADDADRIPHVEVHPDLAVLPLVPVGWMQRVKDLVHHSDRLHE